VIEIRPSYQPAHVDPEGPAPQLSLQRHWIDVVAETVTQ
jgi:hypothetical protein